MQPYKVIKWNALCLLLKISYLVAGGGGQVLHNWWRREGSPQLLEEGGFSTADGVGRIFYSFRVGVSLTLKEEGQTSACRLGMCLKGLIFLSRLLLCTGRGVNNTTKICFCGITRALGRTFRCIPRVGKQTGVGISPSFSLQMMCRWKPDWQGSEVTKLKRDCLDCFVFQEHFHVNSVSGTKESIFKFSFLESIFSSNSFSGHILYSVLFE